MNASGHGERWKLRDDLDFTWVNGPTVSEGYWVVRDPLAKDSFSISEIELQLLRLSDGCRSVIQACRDGLELVRPDECPLQAMLQFFVDARRRGLLRPVGDEGQLGEWASRRSSASKRFDIANKLSGVLFVRFPGLNPNRFVARWVPMPSQATFCAALALAATLVMVALLIVITEFDTLTAQVKQVFASRTTAGWMAVLVLIAGLKTLHELAHVVACRWCGAECRQVGVMLLIGTPCLYCDVSDLWSVPETWKRVAVSSAGMLVEVVVASGCLLVWSCTHDSSLNDLVLVVAVVGSVSTVLVNANPLLRYDGYYILADALRVPNLAAQASQKTKQLFQRIVWGSTAESNTVSFVGRRLKPSWLVFYGIASGTYRVLIVVMIAAALFHACDSTGFGWLGGLIAAVLLTGVVKRTFSGIVEAPTQMVMDQAGVQARTLPPWWRHGRARVIIASSTLMMFTLLCIPIPRTVHLPMVMTAGNAEILYANRSGLISEVLSEGALVQPGQAILKLRDDNLNDQWSQANAALAEANVSLVSSERRRGSRSSGSEGVAFAQQRLQLADHRFSQAESELQQLVVRSHTAGTLAMNLSPSELELGNMIAEGELIGWIVKSPPMSGLAYAEQSFAEEFREGQTVALKHPSVRGKERRGVITAVGRSPVRVLPVELYPQISQRIAAWEEQGPGPGTYYPIEIQWDSSNEAIPLTIRSVATAVVSVDSANGWQRLIRFGMREFVGR